MPGSTAIRSLSFDEENDDNAASKESGSSGIVEGCSRETKAGTASGLGVDGKRSAPIGEVESAGDVEVAVDVEVFEVPVCLLYGCFDKLPTAAMIVSVIGDRDWGRGGVDAGVDELSLPSARGLFTAKCLSSALP